MYELNHQRSKETHFVQVAEMELLHGSEFDVAYIAATRKSYDAHFNSLREQLKYHVNPVPIILSEEMSGRGQWEWFEKILPLIQMNDELTVDLTHGYRSIPIIFSTALNFLQKARNIRLCGVYYGAFDKDRNLTPIIDMGSFYNINEWADGVGRLVDDADARKLAAVAENTPDYQVVELNDEDLIRSFEALTNTIRNVDVNNVAQKANAALSLIEEKKKGASETGKILLNLVIDKFASLTTQIPPTGKYDKGYFEVQIEMIGLLLRHRLFMQAYTVMREFIASICMIPFEREGMNNKKRKKRRRVHAEVFIKLFQFEEKEWDFSDGVQPIVEKLAPFYEQLKKMGIEEELRDLIKDLAEYRNGFDHAWIAKSGAYEDIEEKGLQYFQNLKQVLGRIEDLIVPSDKYGDV